MPEVDYARAWFKLKAKITEKRSFGQDELSCALNEIEVECLVPEGQEGFTDRPAKPDTDSPAPVLPHPAGRDGVTDTPTTAEEGRHGNRHESRRAAVA